MSDDPILNAADVQSLIRALNTKYAWELPLSFPDGSQLAAMWSLPIEVLAGPLDSRLSPGTTVIYRAATRTGVSVAGHLQARLAIEIVASPSGPALVAGA